MEVLPGCSLSFPRVPTYTFPFATVGTVNLTAKPAAFIGPCELFHNSVPRLVASYAWSTVGPHPGDPVVQDWVLSSAHTIASELSGLVDIDGVAPGKLYEVAEVEVGELLIL